MPNVEVGEPVTRLPEEEVEHADVDEAVEEGNARLRTRRIRGMSVSDVERFHDYDTSASETPLKAYHSGLSRMKDPRLIQRHQKDNPYSR